MDTSRRDEESVRTAAAKQGVIETLNVWVNVKCGRTLAQAIEDQLELETDVDYLRELLRP